MTKVIENNFKVVEEKYPEGFVKGRLKKSVNYKN